MKKIFLGLLICAIIVQATITTPPTTNAPPPNPVPTHSTSSQQAKKCINICMDNACNHESDKRKCYSDLSVEVKCFKDTCDPDYKPVCVQECCKSNTCKNLVICANKCPSSQLDNASSFFSSKSKEPVIYDLTKRNNFQQQPPTTQPTINNSQTYSFIMALSLSLLLLLVILY